MKRAKVKFILHRTEEGGYWAQAVGIGGALCVSQGDTKEETLKNIKEALSLYLESL